MSLMHFYLAGDSSCANGKILGVSLYDKLCNPTTHEVEFTKLTDTYILIGNIIRIALSAVGFLAVIFIVIGGIMYIVSTGDPARISRAKGIIEKAIIGLIVSLVSFAAVTFIAGQF